MLGKSGKEFSMVSVLQVTREDMAGAVCEGEGLVGLKVLPFR